MHPGAEKYSESCIFQRRDQGRRVWGEGVCRRNDRGISRGSWSVYCAGQGRRSITHRGYPAGKHRGPCLRQGDGGARQEMPACKDLGAGIKAAANLSGGRSGEERQADAGILNS